METPPEIPVGACVTCGEFECCCYDDDDDGWACTHCGGDGYCEVDDPLWDDCDEYGIGDCSACGGTGERKHQTVF